MTRAKIIDVSIYQGNIDWSAVKAAGILAAAIRCTVGNYYTDPLFARNWEMAKAAGILATAYHVVAPEYSAASQIDRFKGAMAERVPDWPLVLDVELSRGQKNSTIIDCVWKSATLLRTWKGKAPIIYTAKWFWNQYMVVKGVFPAWAKDHPLWLAQYPWDPTPPPELSDNLNPNSIPGGWQPYDWKIWQWTARGNLPGIYEKVDRDGFKGSEAEFVAWAGGGISPPPPPPAPAAGFKMRVVQDGLRVRTGPGTNFTQIGSLRSGEIVDVLDVGGDAAWVEIRSGEWVNAQWGDDRNMEPVKS